MSLDAATLEKLVQEIARAIVEHTGPPTNSGQCADCDGQCAQRCPDRANALLGAGASRLSTQLGVNYVRDDIAHYIDHTLLKPDATVEQITQLCHEALKYNFASVCINPTNVKLAAQLLKGSPIDVCTVVGFPLGATPPEVKGFETQQALNDGATEVDMVINIGALKSGNDALVERDIATVCRISHHSRAICKVILETVLLTDEEKIRACRIAKQAGADFVKTSTGFGGGGATVHDITLMRQTVGPTLGVKASGGIRSLADAESMIAAGATRIGASAGVKIVQEAKG
jgi:deoxyribose-phosphate aldolase